MLSGNTYTPTAFTDSVGGGSLRDAIIAANADPGTAADTIVLGSGTYTLSIPNVGGAQENSALTGDLDITSAPLQKDARTLEAQGLMTRFVSLGHFGHGYPADMAARMREPMQWVAAATP